MKIEESRRGPVEINVFILTLYYRVDAFARVYYTYEWPFWNHLFYMIYAAQVELLLK